MAMNMDNLVLTIYVASLTWRTREEISAITPTIVFNNCSLLILAQAEKLPVATMVD
jgi:hypothetical protein